MSSKEAYAESRKVVSRPRESQNKTPSSPFSTPHHKHHHHHHSSHIKHKTSHSRSRSRDSRSRDRSSSSHHRYDRPRNDPNRNTSSSTAQWSPLVSGAYHPITVGSIDATDTIAHDRGLVRALQSTYRPNKGVQGDPKSTVFIGRLSANTAESSIRDVMQQFGEIRHLRLVRDIITGLSRQYAFVEFTRCRYADRAVSHYGNVFIDGAQVILEPEYERLLPGWKPRRFGGGLGGLKESGQLRFGGRARKFKKPFTCFDNNG